jgi:hypothetical protein
MDPLAIGMLVFTIGMIMFALGIFIGRKSWQSEICNADLSDKYCTQRYLGYDYEVFTQLQSYERNRAPSFFRHALIQSGRPGRRMTNNRPRLTVVK